MSVSKTQKELSFDLKVRGWRWWKWNMPKKLDLCINSVWRLSKSHDKFAARIYPTKCYCTKTEKNCETKHNILYINFQFFNKRKCKNMIKLEQELLQMHQNILIIKPKARTWMWRRTCAWKNSHYISYQILLHKAPYTNDRRPYRCTWILLKRNLKVYN